MPNQRGADWQTKTAHGGAEPTSGVLEIQCARMQIPAETHKREVSLLTWPRRPVAPKPPPGAGAQGGGGAPFVKLLRIFVRISAKIMIFRQFSSKLDQILRIFSPDFAEYSRKC